MNITLKKNIGDEMLVKNENIIAKLGTDVNGLIFERIDSLTTQELIDTLTKFDIEVRYFKDAKCDAFLYWDDNNAKTLIAINATRESEMQNVIIAASLGKLVINYAWLPNKKTEKLMGKFDDITLNNQETDVFEQFAMHFLMPDQAIKRALAQIPDQEQNYQNAVYQISQTFTVPVNFALKRVNTYLDNNE